MNKGLVATIATVVVSLVVLGLVIFGSYVSAFNAGNKYEQQVEAEWTNNKNILAQYGQKIQEAAQIPSMQADDVAKILTGALDARYGSDGSKAAFQWIQEKNPNVTSEVYVKLQQIIEGGRDKFENAQTRLIDVKRAYKTELGSLWRGFWMRLAGYPKADLNKFNIVTTGRTEKAFDTGVEEPIKLRN